MPDINCLYCPQQLHYMCNPDEDECCCHGKGDETADLPIEQFDNALNLKEEKRPVGRPLKTEGFVNLISTGRKRAAKLYAIQPGQLCAWAWKENCGGGVEPIIGCSGRLARDIHHGPDKSVLNNSPTNVSVICKYCHNKWHGINDKYYPGERPDDGAAWLPVGDKIYELSDMKDADPFKVVEFELEMGREVDMDLVREKMREDSE